MPSLTISVELFKRLVRRAAALHMTVEQLIAALLHSVTESDDKEHPTPSPAAVPFNDWKKAFEGWMTQVRARASRYPPGFVLDDSQERIYQGCGE
jgi:hypothetical protein